MLRIQRITKNLSLPSLKYCSTPSIHPLASSTQRSFTSTISPSYASTNKNTSNDDQLFTFQFDQDHWATHKCEPPAMQSTITKKELIQLYRNMVAVRRLETASDQLYKAKMIRGFCHLSTGQEAVAVGMEVNIN